MGVHFGESNSHLMHEDYGECIVKATILSSKFVKYQYSLPKPPITNSHKITKEIVFFFFPYFGSNNKYENRVKQTLN